LDVERMRRSTMKITLDLTEEEIESVRSHLRTRTIAIGGLHRGHDVDRVLAKVITAVADARQYEAARPQPGGEET
jgi:hypothetical protein